MSKKKTPKQNRNEKVHANGMFRKTIYKWITVVLALTLNDRGTFHD